jgi:hypothetical protein
MAPLIPVAISGAIELIKLGSELLETWKTNPEDQAAMDAKWAEMQAKFSSAKAAWEASKS